MPSIINRVPLTIPPVTCDFDWYYGITPTRLGEGSFKVGTTIYPPAFTTLTGSQTLPLATINVASATSFETSGSIVIDNGTAHQTVQYTGKTLTSFTGCTGGVGTFGDKTPVYDPRFYVDQMPLYQLITFDAIDHLGLGLPAVVVPAGITITSYQWDFGNGQIGYGPFASTTYTYSQAPPGLQIALSVTDSLGRISSCAHRANLQSLGTISGTAYREIPGTARV